MDECEGQVEAIGERGGALGTAGVGRDDDTVFDRQVFLYPAQNRGLGVEVVDGDVEEALDLPGREGLATTWLAGCKREKT